MTRLIDLRAAAQAASFDLPAESWARDAARATWRGRMINELHSAPVFEALADQLAEAGAPEWVDEVREMAAEERRHGVLCGAVVEALGGAATLPERPSAPMPRHEDVDRHEAVTRNLLSVCCLSETVAVALIGAERLRTPEGPLRAVLAEILADEVGHARLGWRWLAAHAGGWDAPTRARLEAYLRVAFAHLEAHELSHLPETGPVPAAAQALGVCDGGEARRLFYDAVEQVIIPRLCAFGLDARAAWRTR